MIKLSLKKRPGTFWTFEDNADYISIGRDSSNDVSILERTLSRNHAIITRRAGAYILEADSELNITQVNSQTVKTKRLKTGDQIRLGEVELVFEIDDDRAHKPSARAVADDLAGTTDFYKELLDIPEGPRPPNHYQLIGVEDFESNIERIKRASLKSVGALKERQLDSQFGDAVQRLLTEVARARVILCNPYTKAQYDDRLKRKEAIELGGVIDANALEELAALEGETYQIITEDIDMTMEERLEALRRNAEFMILEAGINPQERDKILREEADGFGVNFTEVERIVQDVLAAKRLADLQRPPRVAKKKRHSAPSLSVVLAAISVVALVLYLVVPWLKPPPLEEMTNSIGMKLVLVPPGKFTMGSENGEPNEMPAHEVRITKPFYIGKYEVTQREWKAVMGNNPSRSKNDKLPVQNVSWTDCADFCEMLSEKEGVTYRLPTEAEWEYACRAGATTEYSFGDDETLLDKYAWYRGNSSDELRRSSKKKPNAWDIHGMHGNLLEWCADWYDGRYYTQSPTDDPQGPTEGRYRVIRGGSSYSDPRDCRAAFRLNNFPGQAAPSYGFRVVRAASSAAGASKAELVAKGNMTETSKDTAEREMTEEPATEPGEVGIEQGPSAKEGLGDNPPAFPLLRPGRIGEPPPGRADEAERSASEAQREETPAPERRIEKVAKADQPPDIDEPRPPAEETIVEEARELARTGRLGEAMKLVSENEAKLGKDDTQSVTEGLQRLAYAGEFEDALSLLREGNYDKCVELWDNALGQYDSPAVRKCIAWDKRIAETARDIEASLAGNALGKELETEFKLGVRFAMKIASIKRGIVIFKKGKLEKKAPVNELPGSQLWEIAVPDAAKQDSATRLRFGIFLLVNGHPDARQYLSKGEALGDGLAELAPNLAVYEAGFYLRQGDYAAASAALDELESQYERSDFCKARQHIISNMREDALAQRPRSGKTEKILFEGEWLAPIELLKSYVVKSRSYVQSFFAVRRNDLFDDELKAFYEPDLWEYIIRQLPLSKSRSSTIRLCSLKTRIMELGAYRVLDFQPITDESAGGKCVAAKAAVTVLYHTRRPVLEAEWDVGKYTKHLDEVRLRGRKKEEINKIYSCLLIRQSEAIQSFFEGKERDRELIPGSRSKTRKLYRIPSEQGAFWQSMYFVDNENGIVIAVFYQPELQERSHELKALMEGVP